MKRRRKAFEKKLKVYSATAAGALAIAPAAQAAVQYSGIKNLPVEAGQFQLIDLNDDGTDDFRFENSAYDISATFADINLIKNEAGGQGHIDVGDPARLPSNYPIGPNLTFPYAWENDVDVLNGTFTSVEDGDFNNATGYIGVRFNADCGTAYGWIQYQGMTTIGNTATGTIIDWAYEDNCQPILAGEKGSEVPVPTMNQWGLIIFTLLLGGLAAREVIRSSKKKVDASA